MSAAPTVIKFGGSISKNESARKKFFTGFAALCRREKAVLVHGGGPEINTWIEKLGLISKFVGGLRYTDAPVLELVEMVLSGKVNKSMVSEMNKRGVKAVGISGKDGETCLCKRIPVLGFVGEPVKIDTGLIGALLRSKFLPVVSSIGFDRLGRRLNVNADSMARALAIKLKTRRLILLTDVPGVLDAQGRTIREIKIGDIDELIKSEVVTGGMIPKINACKRAVLSGIREVWIIDGSKGLAKMEGSVIKK